MKYLKINDKLNVSQLVMGCMRFKDLSVQQVEQLVEQAIKLGINFFDHADIYGDGKCEELFGEVLLKHPEWRHKIYIQTKCGIIKRNPITYYDFSYEHIINSVNNSLKRLKTDYIDVLLLHRPDTLIDCNEVVKAFTQLYNEKKVRYFGVSNFNSLQIELLQSKLPFPLLFNQLQVSPVHANMFASGLFVNTKDDYGINRDDSILEYCRIKNITIQPWSILQVNSKIGTFLNNPDYVELNQVLERLANKYKVSKTAIVIAWLIKHPANMQPVFGTTSTKHLEELCQGVDVNLTKPEWYEVLVSGIKHTLP